MFKFNKSHLPNLISISRLIISPIFFYTILNEFYFYSLILFLFAAFSDALDGYIARKTNSNSDKGAYLDVWADFIFIIFGFAAFIITGWYDPLVMVLIFIMFSLFLLTSPLKIPVYDPVGKYLGAFLMGMILFSLIFLYPLFRNILLILFALFCLISVISRLFFFYKNR